MANNKEKKLYALIVLLKPKPEGKVRYSSKSYRGFAHAVSPAEAKEITIEQFHRTFNDGNPPVISRDDIIIKDCKCHSDFFAKTKE